MFCGWGDGCAKASAIVSLNRTLTVGFDSNWVNDGDNQMVTPTMVPQLVTTGSEILYLTLLFIRFYSKNSFHSFLQCRWMVLFVKPRFVL